MQLVWIASLFFGLLIALFAVQNTTPVTVNLLIWRIEAVAVSLVMLAAVALGALLTYLLGVARQVRSHVALRGNRSTIRDQDALIAQLRDRVRDLEADNERLRGPGQSALPPRGESLAPSEPTPAANVRRSSSPPGPEARP